MTDDLRAVCERLLELELEASEGPWIAEYRQDMRNYRLRCGEQDKDCMAHHEQGNATLIAYSRNHAKAIAERCLEMAAFMDGVRDAARNRNPEGATLLDFMACWNEQYEARLKQLEAENAALRARGARNGECEICGKETKRSSETAAMPHIACVRALRAKVAELEDEAELSEAKLRAIESRALYLEHELGWCQKDCPHHEALKDEPTEIQKTERRVVADVVGMLRERAVVFGPVLRDAANAIEAKYGRAE